MDRLEEIKALVKTMEYDTRNVMDAVLPAHAVAWRRSIANILRAVDGVAAEVERLTRERDALAQREAETEHILGFAEKLNVVDLVQEAIDTQRKLRYTEVERDAAVRRAVPALRALRGAQRAHEIITNLLVNPRMRSRMPRYIIDKLRAAEIDLRETCIAPEEGGPADETR